MLVDTEEIEEYCQSAIESLLEKQEFGLVKSDSGIKVIQGCVMALHEVIRYCVQKEDHYQDPKAVMQ